VKVLAFPTTPTADVLTLQEVENTEYVCREIPQHAAFSVGSMARFLGSYRLVLAELERVDPKNALLARVKCTPSSTPPSAA
jgi:hypothetical protein